MALEEEGNESPPRIGAANETITLEGKEFVLKPSLELAEAIGDGPGCFFGAVNRCRNWDPKTIVMVVKLGCDKLAGTDAKRVKKAVYEAGYADLAPACIRIVEALCFGGRRPPDGTEAKGSEEVTEPDPLAASA